MAEEMRYGQSFTPSGPTSAGMGSVTDQEIQMMNRMAPSRQQQLEQRAYQSYIEALNRLRAAEAAGNPNAMGMSGVVDAQNRLNAVRQPTGSISNTEMRTYEVDGRPVQMSQEEMMRAVQSGQITPGQAATMSTGVADPTAGSMTDSEMGALNNLPEDINDVGSFLRNLQQKGNAQ